MLRDDRKLTKCLYGWAIGQGKQIHTGKEPGSFKAATQVSFALDAHSKAESGQHRGRRSGHVSWRKSEKDHVESTTPDLRALHTSMSSDFTQTIEF